MLGSLSEADDAVQEARLQLSRRRLDLFRLVQTRANGQPAFGCYLPDPHTPIAHAYGLMVLTLRDGRVAAITGFPDTSVFPHFGLPRTLRE